MASKPSNSLETAVSWTGTALVGGSLLVMAGWVVGIFVWLGIFGYLSLGLGKPRVKKFDKAGYDRYATRCRTMHVKPMSTRKWTASQGWPEDVYKNPSKYAALLLEMCVSPCMLLAYFFASITVLLVVILVGITYSMCTP